MINNTVIQTIQILLKQGKMSQRQIAKHIGVSRGTVQAVAKGKRTLTVPKAVSWVAPTGQPKRCPQCGGQVRMPCLACQIFEGISNRVI
jgi:Predicted transcriptional regulators